MGHRLEELLWCKIHILNDKSSSALCPLLNCLPRQSVVREQFVQRWSVCVLKFKYCAQIEGRMDDVINISGHRLGTSEVEDAINLHPQVSESGNYFQSLQQSQILQTATIYVGP